MTDSAGRAMMGASEDFFEEESLLQRILSYLIESLKILKCSFVRILYHYKQCVLANVPGWAPKLVHTTSFKSMLEQMVETEACLTSCLIMIMTSHQDTYERKPDSNWTVKVIYLLVTLLEVTPVKHAPLYKLWNVSYNTSIWDGDDWLVFKYTAIILLC